MAERAPANDRYLMAFALKDGAVTVAMGRRDSEEEFVYLLTMGTAEARRLASELERAAIAAERPPCVSA